MWIFLGLERSCELLLLMIEGTPSFCINPILVPDHTGSVILVARWDKSLVASSSESVSLNERRRRDSLARPDRVMSRVSGKVRAIADCRRVRIGGHHWLAKEKMCKGI